MQCVALELRRTFILLDFILFYKIGVMHSPHPQENGSFLHANAVICSLPEANPCQGSSDVS